MNQCEQVLEWLRTQGSITPAQAYEQFGVIAMHSRAAELRERGFNVICTIQTNDRRRWGSYTLGVDG